LIKCKIIKHSKGRPSKKPNTPQKNEEECKTSIRKHKVKQLATPVVSHGIQSYKKRQGEKRETLGHTSVGDTGLKRKSEKKSKGNGRGVPITAQLNGKLGEKRSERKGGREGEVATKDTVPPTHGVLKG